MPRASPYQTRGLASTTKPAKPTSTSTTTTKTPTATRTSARRATISASSSSASSVSSRASSTSSASSSTSSKNGNSKKPTTTTSTTTTRSTSSSSSSSPAFLSTKWGVFLFLPNLIGYLRVFATMYSLYLGVQDQESWEPVVYLYFFAFALDAVDGYVARLVGQSSSFGAVLDMVTDRTATAGLVMLNLLVEKDEMRKFGWISLVMLDIGSHWFHCISSKGHHKSDDANKNKNIFLRLYYGCLPLFFACCIGQEAFYLLNFIKEKGGNQVFGWIYAPSWIHSEMRDYFPLNILETLWQITLVLGAIKQVVNVAQLASAAAALAEDDAEARKKKK